LLHKVDLAFLEVERGLDLAFPVVAVASRPFYLVFLLDSYLTLFLDQGFEVLPVVVLLGFREVLLSLEIVLVTMDLSCQICLRLIVFISLRLMFHS